MIIEDKEDVCFFDHVDLTNNFEQAMHVAVLSFGRWALRDVDNEDNCMLLGSNVFKRNRQSFHPPRLNDWPFL